MSRNLQVNIIEKSQLKLINFQKKKHVRYLCFLIDCWETIIWWREAAFSVSSVESGGFREDATTQEEEGEEVRI